METIQRLTANVHTHTTWCDGKCSAEDMVKAAIDAGFTCIGFSGHSYTWFDESYAMTKEGTEKYRREILELKEAYRSVIDVKLGVEWDGDAEGLDPREYEFTIGSCHYLQGPQGGRYYTVDLNIEELEACRREVFCGDGEAMAEAYYRRVIRMVEERRPTIVGHLDLIRKLNAGNRFFDETGDRYLHAAKTAAEACVREGSIIEINTGGVFKCYRNTPYPAEPVLRHIAALGGKVTVNSDAHETRAIDFMFSQALALMKRCGFSTVWQMTAQGMKEFRIQ